MKSIEKEKLTMSNELKNNELLNEAVENITEEELMEIAAAGDTNPEATPSVVMAVTAVTALGTNIFSCGKGFGCK